MNTKKILNFYILICLFPAWLLSSNIILNDKFLFFLPYIFLFIILTRYFNLKFESKFNFFLLSIITVFGLDQNLSLYQNIIKPNFIFLNKNLPNIYFADLLIVIIILIIIFIIFLFLKKKAIKILFSFLLIISIFKIYQVIQNPINIINFDKTKKLEANNDKINKVLIIVLDEMSGIDSTEKDYKFGDVFLKKINKLATTHDLSLYTNSFSISDNTANSVPFMLNFETRQPTTELRETFIEKSKGTFNEYDLIQNNLFQKFKKISVIQNVHLNFCKQKNVKKCYQMNPYSKNNNYLEGFKNNFLTTFFTYWYLDGSSIARLFFKFSRLLNLSDTLLEPESHKIFLPSIFSKLENDVKENKFDLIFAHILAPHIPYGFSLDCKYDGRKSSLNNYMTSGEKYVQHNIERICMVKFIDNLLNNIKKTSGYNNLDIFIMSDHGSRITSNENFSSILLTKTKNTFFRNVNEKILIHNEIKKIFLKKYN